ncbi:unnamed protein product [Ixodes hexagonus]
MGTGMVNGQLRSGYGTSGTQDKARERARPEEGKPRGGPQPSQPGPGETLQRVPGGVSGAFPRQQVTTGSAWGDTDACPQGAGTALGTPLANGQQTQLAPPLAKAPLATENTAVAPVFASIPRTVPLTSVSQTVPQHPALDARPQDEAQSAFTPVAPQHRTAPQHQAMTHYPVASQHQAAPHHQAVPQHQTAPQQQDVPQFQPVPQHQAAPQHQSTPQYQATQQHQSAPQFQVAPQLQSNLQYQNGSHSKAPSQHQGALQFQGVTQYQTGPQPQLQASPEQQGTQQYQSAPQHQAIPQQPPSVEVIEPPAGESAQERQGADVDQKPKSIDLAQKRTKPESQDWSPVTDLSPILDVSPSVEAAEQELMRRFQEDDRPPLGIPRATSGTISGMLADFNKAMGLASPGQEPPGESADSPATPKRVHRRLPQPTMEQMQAAVALAAQGPGQTARPVSPMVPATRKDASTAAVLAAPAVAKPVPAPRAISAPTVLTVAVSGTVVTATVAPPGASMTPQPAPCKGELGVPSRASLSSSPVPLTRTLTPVTPQTPGPQGGDSSDPPSEADSSGGKVRRKLPPLPQDQEPSPVPARRAKDRARVLSAGALDRSPRPKPQPPRASSMDGATASLHGSSLLLLPPAASPATSLCERPGSAASFLGPDAGSRLPSYMNSLKQQLREELKTVTGERRRLLELRDRERDLQRRSETDLAALLAGWTTTAEPLRPGRRSATASPLASPRRSRHRRHLSDPRAFRTDPLADLGAFKSYEYECLDERPASTLALAARAYDASLGRLDTRGASLSDVRLADADALWLRGAATRPSDDPLARYRRPGWRPRQSLGLPGRVQAPAQGQAVAQAPVLAPVPLRVRGRGRHRGPRTAQGKHSGGDRPSAPADRGERSTPRRALQVGSLAGELRPRALKCD